MNFTTTVFIGIVSTNRFVYRRNAIRMSWIKGYKDYCFVLDRDKTSLRESYRYGDVCLLTERYAGYNSVPRVLDFLSIKRNHTFIALADDDSFLHIPNIRRDLDFIHGRMNYRSLFYGGLEWAAVNKHSFEMVSWAFGIFSASWNWRQKTKRHGDICRTHSTRESISRPFPFMKGPLMVMGQQTVDLLRNQAQKSQYNYKKFRILVDVFIGYILSKLDDNITYVNVGVGKQNGCVEIRTNAVVKHWKNARVVHLNKGHINEIALKYNWSHRQTFQNYMTKYIQVSNYHSTQQPLCEHTSPTDTNCIVNKEYSICAIRFRRSKE